MAVVGEREGLDCRRFEVAGMAVELRQDMRGSRALRPLDDDRVWAADGGGEEDVAPLTLTVDDLSWVGHVVWQAGFVLADLLLRCPPFGAWHGTVVLDLGCGTGLVGILLALAGSEVVLTDQPHIIPLAEQNAQANLTPGLHRARVVEYTWGQGDAAEALLHRPPAGAAPPTAAPAAGALPGAISSSRRAATSVAAEDRVGEDEPRPGAYCFDCITCAEVLYQPESYPDLAATLRALAAPHTLVFLAFKRRGLQADRFLELLEGAGFAVRDVPQNSLAPEYRTGAYRVLRACRIE